jgi:hypothetical protein
MKLLPNYLLFILAVGLYFSFMEKANAASRNQTFSEYGIAFTYNTHLLEL